MSSRIDASGASEHQTVVREERQRLARELHDGPVQALTVIALRLGVCQRLAGQGDLEALNEELARLSNTLRRGMVDLRQIVSALRQPVSDDQRLADMLFDYVEGYRARTGLDTMLDLLDDSLLDRLSNRQRVAVLRVVQEATQNVYKHARASQVRVSFRRQGITLKVYVEDDGRGFDVDHLPNPGSRHLGLVGMREWAGEASGILRVESRPGQGTRVVLTVPLPNPPICVFDA